MTEVLTEVTAWALRQGSVCSGSGRCATWIMSARPECWKDRAFSERDCCAAGCCNPNISDEPRDCYSYARVR